MLGRASSRPKPRPPVVLAWGSQSINRVGRPSRARDAAKLMAVVVLPTPPFWLTTAMTLDGLAGVSMAAGDFESGTEPTSGDEAPARYGAPGFWVVGSDGADSGLVWAV